MSAKGVGDLLKARVFAGAKLNKIDGLQVGVDAKASYASGRLTAELKVFGWEFEIGVTGDAIAIGAQAYLEVSPKQGINAGLNAACLFGGGVIFRAKPPQ